MGGEKAHGAGRDQRIQYRLGNLPAIGGVGAAQNFVHQKENRRIMLCGADGNAQSLQLRQELRLAGGELIDDSYRSADGE
jgi:hypothetical protein